MKIYVTFGQSHRHPDTGEFMKDYWVEMEAIDYEDAREKVDEKFGDYWSRFFSEDDFDEESRSYFPKGKYEEITTIDELFEKKVKGEI